jgi:spore maturation protein CgeB
LDKHGDIYAECKKNALPVAVWLVDNPWNIVSGLRDVFWKEVFLFVTDPSFIPGLKAHGAKHVYFLPLATDPEIFNTDGQRTGLSAHPLP